MLYCYINCISYNILKDFRKSVLNMNVDDSLKDEYGRRQEEMRRHRRRPTTNLTVPESKDSSSATPSSSEDEETQNSRRLIKKSPSRTGKKARQNKKTLIFQ